MTDLVRNTAAVILAGGKGTRLDPLTRGICKPALPFGAAYRSIDFSLANCVHSGIRTVGVATQYEPRDLHDHLEDVWGSAFRARGVSISRWFAGEANEGAGYLGTAHAVYGNLHRIEQLDDRMLLVLAGDHVYRMDYGPLLEQHRRRGASVTIACVEVPRSQMRHFGIMSVSARDRIDAFVEKPTTSAEVPGCDGSRVLASMGIYVFDGAQLRRALAADARAAGSRHDFGRDVLPRLIDSGRAFAYEFRSPAGGAPEYWRDIGTLDAYWQAHMELLGQSPHLSLDDPEWPLPAPSGAPRLVEGAVTTRRGGRVENSLVASDCSVSGSVRDSVVFGGVDVRGRAQVAESVILPGAVIGEGSRLRGVIVDSRCRVMPGTIVERSTAHDAVAARPEPPVLTTDSNALGLDGRKLSVARAVGALMVCDLSAWSGLAAGFV